MARPRSASQCRTETRVVTSGAVQIVHCARAQGHPGPHSAKVIWPPRVAAPPRSP